MPEDPIDRGPADQASTKDIASLLTKQSDMARELFSQLVPGTPPLPKPEDTGQWAEAAQRLQSLWLDYQSEQALLAAGGPAQYGTAYWLNKAERWYAQMPLANTDTQARLWEDGLALWQTVLGQYGIGPKAAEAKEGRIALPRSDRRFADPKWSEQPFFALVHQTYLMLAEQITAMADGIEGLPPSPDGAPLDPLRLT